MKNLNQKGFTIIEVLLVVIALSLVIGVGYYVYNSTEYNEATSSTSKTETKQTSANPNSKPVKYLSIKELGIKIPLTDGLEDMQYSIPQAEEIMLTSKSLGELQVKSCGVDPQSGVASPGYDRIMSISKVEGQHTSGTQETEDFFLKQFDNFYIKGSYGNLGCGDVTKSAATKTYTDKLQKLYEAANDAIKSSELI